MIADPEDQSRPDWSKLHPADLADKIQRLSDREARELLAQLPPDRAAAALAELEVERAREILPGLPIPQLAEILQRLPHKEGADLAADLPDPQRSQVLAGLTSEQAGGIKALLQYRPDSAGGIMSDRFIALRPDWRLAQALEHVRAREPEAGEVGYLYVTDAKDKLVGVVSLRELVFRNPERRVEEVMNRDVKWLGVEADQEQIAREFGHYHYLGLPVLEQDGRLVGVVRASDVLQIAQAEATEDMQLMVGLSGEERALTPWHRSMTRRLPWLYVNLATAFLAAGVVSLFESTIARWTVLAVFLPIVAGQGGNAGVQTLTVIIRDLALGEIGMRDAMGSLRKELILGLVNGLAIGVVVALIGYLWKGDWRLGLIIGLAMWLNMLAAGLSGVLIPYGLKLLKVDPALASSIFLTTVTDVAGFFFFLGLAALGMRWLG